MIERQTPAEAGNQYGKTTVRVKPNQSAITEDKSVLEGVLNGQSNLTELYTEPTYDELKEALASFLNPSDDSNATTTSSTTTTSTTTSTPKVEPTVAAKENVSDAFDDLFNS